MARWSRYNVIRACSRSIWDSAGRPRMLSVERLGAAYGESQVLWDVDVEVPSGRVVCLLGRNGMGKTTVLKTIMGLLPARGGRVTIAGADITRWAPDRRAGADKAYVRQRPSFTPDPTGGD